DLSWGGLRRSPVVAAGLQNPRPRPTTTATIVFRTGALNLTSRSTSRHVAHVARLRTRSSTRPAQFPARDFLRSIAHPERAHWHRYVGGKAPRFPNSSTARNAPRALCSPPSLPLCRDPRRQFPVRTPRAQPLPRPVE